MLVRTADLAVGCSEDTLVTDFVGSCVVVVLHDSVARVGGMAHVLLDSSDGMEDEWLHPGRFADTAVRTVVDAMERRGAQRVRMTARIAGGANMFPAVWGQVFDIGARNVEAVRRGLKTLSIPVVTADVGGSRARSIVFDVSTGAVSVRTDKTYTRL